MTHPRDAKGRSRQAHRPPHVIFPSGAPCRRSAGRCSDMTAPAIEWWTDVNPYGGPR